MKTAGGGRFRIIGGGGAGLLLSEVGGEALAVRLGGEEELVSTGLAGVGLVTAAVGFEAGGADF